MAQISIVSKGTTYITYQVTGLDPGYTETTRQITWYIKKNTDSTYQKIGTVDLNPGVSSSGTYKIYDLIPGATYIAMCVISNIQGSSDIALYSAVEKTNGSAPVINSFTANPVTTYGREITWGFSGSNLYYGTTTYEILVNKVGESRSTSMVFGVIKGSTIDITNFTVDDYGDYEVCFILDTNGYSDTYTVTITTQPYPAPVINSFSVVQVAAGSKEIQPSWSVKSGIFSGITTYKVYARKAGTSEWYLKLSDIRITNTSIPTFYVDGFGSYEFYLVLDTDGSSATSNVVTLNVKQLDSLTPVITSILYRNTGVIRELTFSWDCSETSEDVECDLYGKQSSSGTWKLLGSQGSSLFYSRSIYLTLNNEIGDYDFYIQTTYAGTSEKSDVVTCTLEKYDTIDLEVTRIPKGFDLSWTPLEGVSSYEWSIVRNYDSLQTYWQTIEKNSITIDDNLLKTLFEQDDAEFGEINYGITYQILIDADNFIRQSSTLTSWNGDFSCKFTKWFQSTLEQNITSAPARPIITSATQSDGVITVSWELEDDSNISHVYFNLYDSNGNVVSGCGKDFQNTTSGTFSFPAVSDGQYEIRVSSSLVVDGEGEIHSVNDDGSEYKLYYNIFIGDIEKPEKWEWSTGIAVGKSLIVNATGIHPITADEWKDFIDRINEFRVYKGYDEYNFSTVKQGGNFKSAYNEAVAAIKGVNGYGALVYYIDQDTPAIINGKFQISLFDKIRNEANAIAGYVD